jgi:hypothetical protein
MPRQYEGFVLVAPTANAQQQLTVDTAQTLTLETTCVAVILGARTQSVSVTFDNTTPVAGTNGLVIVAGAQPVFLPLGYHAEGSHNLKAIGLVAGGFLDVLQLA